MTRIACIPVATALVLALAAPAGAKELSAARACDAEDCNRATAASELRALQRQNPAAPPDRRAPFHRVRMTITEPGGASFGYTVAYVPALGLVREQPSTNGESFWTKPSPRAIAVLDRLTRVLEPIPARRLRGIAPAAVAAASAPADPAPPVDTTGGGASWLLVLVAPVAAAAAWAARRRQTRAASGSE